MKREAKFNTQFNHWLKSVYKRTGAFELKQTTTDSLPFSDVQEHQISALQAVRHGTFVYKIPDLGLQNPYDVYCMTEQPAYVVVKYPKFFCLIAIDTFILEKERSVRRSLTSVRARDIATIVVVL